MPQLTFISTFKKNEGLLLSPSSLLEKYFHGISICTKDGKRVPESVIKQKILVAQRDLENSLDIRLTKRIVKETRDFIKTEYNYWGFLQVTFPVNEVVSLTGYIGTTKQTLFPKDWISNMKSTERDIVNRTVHLVPAGNTSPQTNSIIFVGITPNAGFYGTESVPNYWDVEYCTGWTKVPAELLDAVGKLAAIQMFAILGDILFGAGISSQSLSFDGLSQNIQTTRSSDSSIFASRIKQYSEELKESIPKLRRHYKGIGLIVV